MRTLYGPDYPRTLTDVLAWSGRDPAAPFVTDATGTLDRRAFQRRVLRAAAGLRKAGIGAGARVALWLPNSAGYLAAIFACARLGALAEHINTRFRAAEAGNLLDRSRAVALVTDWDFAPVDFLAILASLPIDDRAHLRSVLALSAPAGVTDVVGLAVLPFEGLDTETGPDAATPRRLASPSRLQARPVGQNWFCTINKPSPGTASMLRAASDLKRATLCCWAQCRSAALSAMPPRWRQLPAARILCATPRLTGRGRRH
jgi:hypothetical protein